MGSSKGFVGKTRMSFPLFDRNTDWEEDPFKDSAREKAPHPSLSPREREKERLSLKEKAADAKRR
jgi:hypothetical protein